MIEVQQQVERRLANEVTARALLLATQEANDALNRLDAARSDVRAHEDVAERLVELLELNPDDFDLVGGVKALLEERAALREQLDRSKAAGASDLYSLALERRGALLNVATELEAFAATLEGLNEKQNASALRRIAEAARRTP
jgi:hypothetical protein